VEGGPLRPQAGAFHRTGGGMIHLSAILQQAALKGVGIFSNVVGQPHETALRPGAEGRGKAGDQSGRSLQVGFHGLLGAVLRDVGKTAVHKVSAL